jgi:energy-coupling factor transporter ATP-binding protein EcfA2
MLWADKYAPKCKDDLAIQPKRVADVSAAVVKAIVDSQAPPASIGYEASRLHVIILTGPPGCGKSAMMRCLATDLSELSGQPRAFELVEWTNPTGFRFDSLSHGAGPKVNYRSELPEFIDTISYRHVYPSLELSGPTLTSKSLPKLLLVEDLPNLHTITQQEQFRAAVRSFCESKIYQPIVFIISDDTEGSSPLRSIFGDGVLELPEVQVIRFAFWF